MLFEQNRVNEKFLLDRTIQAETAEVKKVTSMNVWV